MAPGARARPSRAGLEASSNDSHGPGTSAPRWRGALLLVCAISTAFSPAIGRAQDYSGVERELVSIEGETSRLVGSPLRATPERSATYVEERLTDGELFYRLHDYVRASIILSDIVENFPNHRATPDATYLLGDSLFMAGDYLGARARFRVILDRGNEASYRPLVQRALARLVEIAIRTRNFDGVEAYFQRLSQMPSGQAEASVNYFRAKYLYSRAVPYEDTAIGQDRSVVGTVDAGLLEQARGLFAQVPADSEFGPQARYFVGVIHALRREFPQASEAFRAVVEGQGSTSAHRLVAEMAWLALGRVSYENDQLPQAVDAYQSVPRTSSLFPQALFEIAWVYIRQGDAVKAERALEVLGVAAPDSPLIPDAKLLRGNLLLRAERFDEALRVFREVRDEFAPVRRELDDIAAAHADLQGYFRELVRTNLDDFDIDHFLPESARRWTVLENDEFGRATTVVADLAMVRDLVEETSDLIDRLNGALAAPNVVNVFADLRGQRQGVLALRNRLLRLRGDLARLEARQGGQGSDELRQVRARRRELEAQLADIPTDAGDFDAAAARRVEEVRALSAQVSELEVEVMGLEARVVATERFLEQTAGQQPNASTIRAELANHRAAIAGYREQMTELRRLLELARLGVTLGDDQQVHQDEARAEYDSLLARERELTGSTGTREDAYYARIAAVEARLGARDAEVDRVVGERVANMRRVVDEETQNVVGYRQVLSGLETETEDVVGGVTYATFQNVRHRFYDLVLRADVGRIDVAWQRREQHRVRIETLTRDRADELQRIDDEFREITEGTP